MTRFFTGADPEARELCNAWGLDPNLVRSLEFSISAGRPGLVTVTMFAERQGAEEALHTLRQYRLVPVDEENDDD